jgi:hypothetical protein
MIAAIQDFESTPATCRQPDKALQLPQYIMHATLQRCCDLQGQATTQALHISCHIQAFSNIAIHEVAKYAWDRRRAVRGHGQQMKPRPDRKYRFKLSGDEMAVYRFLINVHKPDSRNHLKFHKRFNVYGSLDMTSEEIARYIKLEVYSVRRALVKLDALWLLDRVLIALKAEDGHYVGSKTLLHLRLDRHLQMFHEIKKNRGVVTPEEDEQNQAANMPVFDASGDDNNVSCNNDIMDPSSSRLDSIVKSSGSEEEKDSAAPLCGDPNLFPEGVLKIGDATFQKFTKAIDDAFPGQLETPEQLNRLRYLILRTSPKDRMQYEDLCAVLEYNMASSVKNLLDYWWVILHDLRVEQLSAKDGYDADRYLKNWSAEASEVNFIESMKDAVQFIAYRRILEPGLKTYDAVLDSYGNPFGALAACLELGLHKKIDYAFTDERRFNLLMDWIKDPSHDFESLMFRQHYPWIMERLGLPEADWNTKKRRVRKAYERMLNLRAHASIWPKN